jgi:hypothetical protein
MEEIDIYFLHVLASKAGRNYFGVISPNNKNSLPWEAILLLAETQTDSGTNYSDLIV